MTLAVQLSKRRLFPCPLCARGLDIRETKKKKPYVICDPCGLQLFVRNQTGMGMFERLVSGAEQRHIWERLEELQHQYQKKCPECKRTFWIHPEQVKTNWMDGSFEGYRCPERGCDGVVKWKEEKKK
jgi:ssDNA-binding Zn-finger/Zn-ribbon topoisomerase 1